MCDTVVGLLCGKRAVCMCWQKDDVHPLSLPPRAGLLMRRALLHNECDESVVLI